MALSEAQKMLLEYLKSIQVGEEIAIACYFESLAQQKRDAFITKSKLDAKAISMPNVENMDFSFDENKNDKKNLNSKIPVIALTANVVVGAKEMYLNEGFDGYLTKPFEPEKVERLIMDLLPSELIESV